MDYRHDKSSTLSVSIMPITGILESR